jgi:hypothetical protein
VQGVSLGSTVAPQLRRGVIIDSLRLLVSFFNHSSVVISQKLFDEIREKYPNLNENSRKYAVRCGLRFVESEESVNIESLISTFSMKSKFLSRLCQTVVNGPQIEILRMLMFQQISSLKNDKRWFYFLRFMRITLVLDEKKTEGYRRNTREWFKDILTGFTVESDVVLGELCRLLQSVFSADVIRQKADQHQQFGSVMYRSFQESDYFTEIPSLILDIIAHHTQYPKTDVVRLLDERKSLILSNHLLAEIVISFFKENPTFLAKPDGWFAGLLDPLSGLFVTASDSITQLFSQFPSAVGNHESAMTLIRVSGYSASCSIPISSSYYRARVKSSPGDSAQRLEMQELLQLTELFLVNPNASSCHAIVGKLVEASKFFDCVSFLLGRLIGISGHFGWVVIVASRYLAAVSESQRAQLITRVSESQKLKPKSRGLAMKRVTEQKKEEAFALALAETDDESVIDRVACAART